MRPSRSPDGAYSITGHGVDTSSITLGSAISKALTIAERVRRTLPEGDSQSLYVRHLGEEVSARIDITPELITTHVLVGGSTR